MASAVAASKHRRSDYMDLGEMPTQTAVSEGQGLPIFEVMATPGPSLELLKRRVEARAETNTCTEWTILGGNGQPVCYNGQTCLFSTVGDLRYEGCGSTSKNYDWITGRSSRRRAEEWHIDGVQNVTIIRKLVPQDQVRPSGKLCLHPGKSPN
jgi:hypothetical protein